MNPTQRSPFASRARLAAAYAGVLGVAALVALSRREWLDGINDWLVVAAINGVIALTALAICMALALYLVRSHTSVVTRWVVCVCELCVGLYGLSHLLDLLTPYTLLPWFDVVLRALSAVALLTTALYLPTILAASRRALGAAFQQEQERVRLADLNANLTNRARVSEAAQREAERRASLVTENASDLIALIDEQGVFQYASPSFRTVLGFDPEALIGQARRTFIHPDDRPPLRVWEAIPSTTEGTYTYRHLHASGRYCWIETRWRLFDDNGQRALVSVGRDITERRRLEDEIRQLTQHARCLLWFGTVEAPRGLDEPLVWRTHAFDNEGAQRFMPLVLKSGEGYMDAWARSLHESDRSATLYHARSALESGADHYTNVFRGRQIDGTVRWFAEDVQITPLEHGTWRVVGVVVDTTEQRVAEQQQAESDRRFRLVLDSAPIWVATQDRRLRYTWGDNFPPPFSVENVTGKNDFDLLGPAAAPLIALKQRVLATGTPEREDVRLVLPSGEVIYDFHCEAQRDEAGVIVGLRCVLVDVTDRHRAEQAVKDAYDATLEGWMRALDLRDRETEGHSQRVIAMTVSLARALGFSEDALVHVRRGSLLHDIGKIGVPDAVLHKPGPLNEDEWAIMQRHAIFSCQLLAPIRYLQPAMPIPCNHHERWDGSGYPNGLAGEDIPFEARVFAVIDAWDAMTNDRPYRAAMSAAAAEAELLRSSGRAFDPGVVRAFLLLLHNDRERVLP